MTLDNVSTSDIDYMRTLESRFDEIEKHQQATPSFTYWYLATPYSNYAGGPAMAFVEASRIAGALIRSGVNIFCPIAHGHPIQMLGLRDIILPHDRWMRLEEKFMETSGGLLVAELPGWQESKGVTLEIEHFTKAAKPVIYLPIQMADLSR